MSRCPRTPPWIAVAAAVWLTLPSAAFADNQIVRSDTVNDVCKNYAPPNLRASLVYVDLASVSSDNLDWGLSILNRLSLGPRERLSIYTVDPKDMATSEAFDLCYPALTPEEIAEAEANQTFYDRMFSFEPSEQQKENIEIFEAKLKGALNQIARKAKAAAGTADRRNVFEAISLDKTRAGDGSGNVRIVVISDMRDAVSMRIESSNELESELDTFSKRFPLNTAGSDVFVFGVVADAGRQLDKLEMFFKAYMQKTGTRLASFAYAMPQQGVPAETSFVRLNGVFTGGGAKGQAELRLFLQDEEKVARASLNFRSADLEYWLPITLEGKCGPAACSIAGIVDENVPLLSLTPYFRRGDTVKFTGTASQLVGEILPAGEEVFDGTEAGVNYALQLEGRP